MTLEREQNMFPRCFQCIIDLILVKTFIRFVWIYLFINLRMLRKVFSSLGSTGKLAGLPGAPGPSGGIWMNHPGSLADTGSVRGRSVQKGFLEPLFEGSQSKIQIEVGSDEETRASGGDIAGGQTFSEHMVALPPLPRERGAPETPGNGAFPIPQLVALLSSAFQMSCW